MKNVSLNNILVLIAIVIGLGIYIAPWTTHKHSEQSCSTERGYWSDIEILFPRGHLSGFA